MSPNSTSASVYETSSFLFVSTRLRSYGKIYLIQLEWKSISFFSFHMDQSRKVKLRDKFWFSRLNQKFQGMTLIHTKRPFLYSNSNLVHMGLRIRWNTIVRFLSSLPVILSCSSFLSFLHRNWRIKCSQPSLSNFYFPFCFKAHFSFSLALLFPFHCYTFLFLPFPFISANYGTLFYRKTRVEFRFRSQPWTACQARGSNRIEQVSCELQHSQASCEAVSETDHVLNDRSSENKSRTWWELRQVHV